MSDYGQRNYDQDKFGKRNSIQPRSSGFQRFLVFLAIIIALSWGYKSWQEKEKGEEKSFPSKAAKSIKDKVAKHVPQTLFIDIPDININSMKLNMSPEGSVYVTTKYGITKFIGGDIRKRIKILDSDSYNANFGRRMKALSTSHITDDGVLWVGNWYGEILSFTNGEWVEHSPAFAESRGRITSIVSAGDEVYIGTNDGLWLWEPGMGDGLEKLDVPGVSNVKALAFSVDGDLIVGLYHELLIHREGQWRSLWKVSEGDKSINTIYADANGLLLVGTMNGIARIDGNGLETGRELKGRWVTEIRRAESGQLWVGTWDEGLYLKQGGKWAHFDTAMGLADNSLSSILLDERNRVIWMAIYGGGVMVGDSSILSSQAGYSD